MKHLKDQMYEKYPYAQQDILNQLGPAKRYRNKRVLIAGCGAGSRLFNLHFYGADITAIDQSSAAIEFIHSQFEELDEDPPELINDDLTTHEFSDNEYDFVICKGVLHHTTAPESILTNLRKACKDDGSVELLLYHSGSPAKWERKLIEKTNSLFGLDRLVPAEVKREVRWEDKYENPLWRTYTLSEAQTLCTESGLSVDNLYLSGSSFGRLTRAIVPEVVRYSLSKPLKNTNGISRSSALQNADLNE